MPNSWNILFQNINVNLASIFGTFKLIIISNLTISLLKKMGYIFFFISGLHYHKMIHLSQYVHFYNKIYCFLNDKNNPIINKGRMHNCMFQNRPTFIWDNTLLLDYGPLTINTWIGNIYWLAYLIRHTYLCGIYRWWLSSHLEHCFHNLSDLFSHLINCWAQMGSILVLIPTTSLIIV